MIFRTQAYVPKHIKIGSTPQVWTTKAFADIPPSSLAGKTRRKDSLSRSDDRISLFPKDGSLDDTYFNACQVLRRMHITHQLPVAYMLRISPLLNDTRPTA